MSQFDDFVEALKDGAEQLAREVFGGFEVEAREDAEAFLDKTENDMRRWTEMLAKRNLTERDFADLVQAKKALAEIHFLRQKGVALTRIERFRSGLLKLVVDTAFDVFV